MRMTLKEAKECLSRNDCEGCKFHEEHNAMDCFHTAERIAVVAINYLIIGTKLAEKTETKDT